MTTSRTAAAPLWTPSPEGKLTGRVAFVTGGTRGIGAAISQSLARQGTAIAAGYAGNVARAEAFAAEFRSWLRMAGWWTFSLELRADFCRRCPRC